VNATERIRAALARTEAERHATEVPPLSQLPSTDPPEPVESMLRLVSTGDAERVTGAEPAAAPPEEEPPAREAAARSPAETVELLRSSLAPAPARREAPAAEPRPAPVHAVAPTAAHSAAPDEDAAAELRSWAAHVPAKRKRVSWIWIILVAVVAMGAAGAVWFRSAWLPGRAAPPPAAATLQLGVESEDNGLISLRWNGQSVPVARAREGRLSILEDQKAPRMVPLTAGQLGAGHLFYESSSERVEFQLEVVEKSGAVVRESAVAAKKPDAAAEAPAPAETPQPVASANPQTQSPPVTPPAVETPKPAPPVLRPFTPPPAPVKSEEASEGRVTLMEPAPALAGGSAVPAGTILPERVDIIPPPQVAAPPAAQRRIQVGGKLQAALLLRKVEPVYPTMARQMRIQGTVRFQAVIGKEGAVQDLQFVSGPRALEKAAADAVKRWVYRPTLLNGRPVEVSTLIDINFSLGN
jgi:protein TonB